MVLLQLQTSVFAGKAVSYDDFTNCKEAPHLDIRGDVQVQS